MSQALYAIRRDLGTDDVVLGSTDLRLNEDRLSCDYWDFLRQVKEGAEGAAADLRTAPLLEGFELPEVREFEFWSEESRNECEQKWRAVASRVAEQAARAGDSVRSVRLRRLLANADPLSGRAAVDFARALVASGDREAGIRQLRIHAVLVQQELEAAPSAEVLRLMEELQRGEVSSPPPAPTMLAPTMPAVEVPVASQRVADPVAEIREDKEPVAAPRPAPPRWPVFAIVSVFAVVMAIVALGLRGVGKDGAPQAAVADTVPVLAVGTIGGDAIGETIASMLATNLARAEGIAVVSAARMMELQAGAEAAAGASLRAAREAGAQELIEGTILRDGARWRLDLRRIELTRGVVVAAYRSEASGAFALVDSASVQLLQSLSRSAPSTSVAEVSTKSLEAWRLYQAARRAQSEGRDDAARAQLRGALAEDSTFALAALALSGMLPEGGRESRAFLELAMRMQQRAAPRDAMLIRATWLVEMNDPAADAIFDTLAARYPNDLEVRMGTAGPALFQRGDFARAHAALLSVWVADSARIGRGAGRCYACEAVQHIVTVAENQDSLAAAESWMKRYLKLAPNDVLAWHRLASLLERDVNRHRELEKLVSENVDRGFPASRGWLLQAASRRGDTAAFSGVEATLDPASAGRTPTSLWDRAIMYRNAGAFDRALAAAQAYRRVSQSAGPGTTPPTVLEAVVHLERGAGAQAAAIFDSIAFARPQVVESEAGRARRVVWNRTLAATARYEAGDTTGLFALADTLAVLGPRSRYVRDHYLHHHVRGLAWLARQRYENAAAEFRRAIVFPSLGFTRSNWYLAKSLVALGRTAEARTWLEAAARAPRDASSLYLNPVAVRAELRRLPRR